MKERTVVKCKDAAISITPRGDEACKLRMQLWTQIAFFITTKRADADFFALRNLILSLAP
jgi:hypothetical protein